MSDEDDGYIPFEGRPPALSRELERIIRNQGVANRKQLMATLESGETVEAWPIYQKLNFGKLD